MKTLEQIRLEHEISEVRARMPEEPLKAATLFGLTNGYYFGSDSEPCPGDKCQHTLHQGDAVFLDTDGRVWCDACGKCERYARKKAAQRAAIAAGRS